MSRVFLSFYRSMVKVCFKGLHNGFGVLVLGVKVQNLAEYGNTDGSSATGYSFLLWGVGFGGLGILGRASSCGGGLGSVSGH